MRRHWLLVLASVTSALAAALWTLPAAAAEKASAMVIDANTGKVLHDKAGSEPRYPASLTKMMTLYLAFETIEAGRLDLSTPIDVSERAAGAAPSKLGLDAGSQIPLRDAIKALIVKSANDMAIAIAEKIGGTEDAFARLMTKRARQIGMRDTTFRNASGLPDPEQVTTARDMLTLAMRLQDDFPQHYKLFATRSFSYGGKTYQSHNSLIGRFPGVDGIKTGYTRASGFNLVSSYRAGGKYVVAAVFGGASAGVRDAHMRMLIARAIDTASTVRTRKSGPQLIAEAKPAQRPAAKPVKKPEVPVAAPAPQTIAEADVPAPAPEPAVVEPAVVQVAPESEPAPAAPTPHIAIAKVKTVSVLAPVEETATATAIAPEKVPSPSFAFASSATARPDFAALKAHLAAQASQVGSPRDIAPADASAPAPHTFAAAAEPSILAAARETQGRPPSTLQAQLASLNAGSQATADQKPALQAAVDEIPAPVPVPVSTGVARQAAVQPAPSKFAGVASGSSKSDFHVQIGVYGSPTEAERAMAAAKTKAAHLLGGSQPVAVPITKGDRQLYRARFAGFDSAAATSACNELRRNGLDCFVARAN